MGFTQGEDQGVLEGGGLELEIEGAAETLAQREAPGPHDSRSQRRVDHQVHVAGVVKKPLEDDASAQRQRAERLPRGVEVFHQLGRCR